MSGVPETGGFPVRALLAGIAEAESGGDPSAWVAHDPPTNPKAAPSSGLFQVHRSDWPTLYDETERVRLDPTLSDEEKISRMTEIAGPILKDGLQAALEAARVLERRGIAADVLRVALFVDAAWQTGAGHLLRWAHSTRTGDPREIVNAKRTVKIEVALRNLAAEAVAAAPAILVAFGVLIGFGFAAWLISKLEA